MFISARPRRLSLALAAAILVATAGAARLLPSTSAQETGGAGTLISNRAEAVYSDASGTGYRTVSPDVTVTVVAVAGLAVTPDETEPSATVAPNERVTRLFRVCNTGNNPDLYTLTRAEVTPAPAALVSLHFDLDNSGTLTDGDRAITLAQTLSPRLPRGGCVGVVAVFDTHASQQGAHVNISINARSSVLGTVNGAVEDAGTIINAVGRGAVLTSPTDPNQPPVKLVEARERVTASHGQTLNYTISFRNSGDVTARGVVVRDELPDNLEYVANSLRMGTRSLTDAEDADEGHVAGRRFEVRVAQLGVGEKVELAFQARVSSKVAPGEGVVNTAVVTADNAPSAVSTTTTAVVNPYGLVYEGRSGGSSLISGARVALVSDSTTGQLLTLPAVGSPPNDANANPFSTDGQGRWSFVLAPEQLNPAGQSAKYFLNVTAQGFRARMIEVTVIPPDATGLFTLAVRALDGMPVARAGGFELTTETVLIPRLAAFALNVPMFENSAIEIRKSADRPVAEVGDVVSYRVEVHNATDAVLTDAAVRDVLPPSFHYAEGSARVEMAPAPARPVEPQVGAGGEIVFSLGRLPAGGRAILTYRVRVGANAREGEQVNSATASAVITGTGERLTTEPARASVRVRLGVFSTQQVIVGRVFEDADADGQFDDGERGLAGVRLYLNNGQSVITDSAGQYNFPSVGSGSHVVSLDPLTLPPGYALANSGRRDAVSWTRLLRTPLGGGSLLRQNYALRAPGVGGEEASNNSAAPASSSFTQSGAVRTQTPGAPGGDATSNGRASNGDATNGVTTSGAATNGSATNGVASASSPAALGAGTYEIESNETVEPVAAGAVRVVSPVNDSVVTGAALEIQARVLHEWSVAVEVNGERVSDAKIGERRADRKNNVSTYHFVGINVRPGPNRVRVTAVSPEGAPAETVELTAFGRGPAKRLEIVADKTQLSAGGRDSTLLRVRAYDEWGHPAADGAVALEVSSGRLLRAATAARPAADAEKVLKDGGDAPALKEHAEDANATRRVVTLAAGEGVVEFVTDNAPGAVEVRATTGAIEANSELRITAELRPSILVGLAEVSVGKAAPEMTVNNSDENVRSRIAFFYRGRFLAGSLLTLAYDSQRPLNRTGRDRLFQLDPLERAYPLFGDSSTRFEDAQSNSKLYARIDRGRSYMMFGDFETANAQAGLASYTRRLTGVKVHVENSRGDYVSVAGARPDTSFARDVLPGGALGLARLSHGEILPGSETVVIEVRDRRNPEIILAREPLVRSVDYNLNATTGEIFFLRPVSAFDYALNLVQVVVTYEHAGAGMASAVYAARGVQHIDSMGLRVGASLVQQRQGEFGTFVVGGIDGEKKLPAGGSLEFEWATSRGRAVIGGNLFSLDGSADTRNDGNAYRVELDQPIPYKGMRLRASYARADEGFLNPFGATVTPGARRAEATLEMRIRPSSLLRFGLMDERNRTANVFNSRFTTSVHWTESLGDRLRVGVGLDHRSYTDERAGTETDSNLLTVGAEWQATDKLQISAKREQNLGEADPTYPNQTTLAATYQWNQFTRLFFTQRLASAPITPIGDVSGFAVSGARRETAIGIETKLWRYANLTSRYQLENGVNGSDSFAVIGLQNRFALTKEVALDLGYERGFHLAGAGQSFNALHAGIQWTPVDGFRTTARYELRDRGGRGSVLTLGAAGRIGDNVTTLARLQLAESGFGGRGSSALGAQAALAWRPLHTDQFGLLFSYTRRSVAQDGAEGKPGTRDVADVLSSDAYYQLTRDLELYGRFALKFSDTGTPELARVSALTYLMQGRASYRVGRYFDLAAETRQIFGVSSGTRRTSYGAEVGYWVLPDLRVGGGYNWTGAREPVADSFVRNRSGFYFTISSKLSNLFDLFGTPRENAQPASGASAAPASKNEGPTPDAPQD
ncbi:MAG TPA: SdrD B-like domain-containing protein [Pyrinomonadaceae bacterium]|nr:SdrD B-like domain-containing protein [Pyrinomonadaceae bacterium]